MTISLLVPRRNKQEVVQTHGRAATSTISVRGVEGAAGSISAFAQPVELLSCAGSCTWGGIGTGAPLLTSLCAGCAPLLTPLMPCCAALLTPLVPCCAPLLTPLHANGLGLGIGYCQ